jgi:hypothetical protein
MLTTSIRPNLTRGYPYGYPLITGGDLHGQRGGECAWHPRRNGSTTAARRAAALRCTCRPDWGLLGCSVQANLMRCLRDAVFEAVAAVCSVPNPTRGTCTRPCTCADQIKRDLALHHTQNCVSARTPDGQPGLSSPCAGRVPPRDSPHGRRRVVGAWHSPARRAPRSVGHRHHDSLTARDQYRPVCTDQSGKYRPVW